MTADHHPFDTKRKRSRPEKKISFSVKAKAKAKAQEHFLIPIYHLAAEKRGIIHRVLLHRK